MPFDELNDEDDYWLFSNMVDRPRSAERLILSSATPPLHLTGVRVFNHNLLIT
jgi:hypothetical protein